MSPFHNRLALSLALGALLSACPAPVTPEDGGTGGGSVGGGTGGGAVGGGTGGGASSQASVPAFRPSPQVVVQMLGIAVVQV
ncbi:MAG: hypothetical protein Q8L48_24705, partial [Archangium sp.]|nr:hypothetical protein [Archangium sp.]